MTAARDFYDTTVWGWQHHAPLGVALENACDTAGYVGAVKGRAATAAEFPHYDGDDSIMPASLWTFPDGSALFIGDDGLAIEPVRPAT